MTQPLTLGETQLPSGFWRIDTAKSSVWFVARHLMVSKVWGQFRRFAGTIVIADEPTESSVEAAIEMSSLTTGDSTRDAHLMSRDVFDTDRYPLMRFASSRLERRRPGAYMLSGDLTIRDVTRPVHLDLEARTLDDDTSGERAGFTAKGEISRRDFGIVWNALIESGGAVVGDRVRIEIDVEAVRT
ncbi:MAG TPA: YceI family protein [Acidimicrobiales bacterium]|nr:YceI family protein [Acidimicrobiales bacterium]